MKKLAVLALLSFSSLLASADTITNYVYVVSNLYFREVHEITNNVKNTHYNYYFTNNVSTIQNVYQVTYKTNVTYNVDVSNEAIARASSEADRAERAATNALSSVTAAAASATAAGRSASQASSSASSAATSAANAANAANNGINTINARINWFDQHSGERITVVNYNTNVDVHVAQTIITNDFRHVPYDLDPNLEVNLNAFAMMGKGGTNNVYSMTCPSGCAYDSGNSIGSGTFRFWFDRFELVNGKGKFWYKSDYDTGVPNNFSGRTWRFEWAYWYEGVWHVAIRQRRMSSGTVTENNLYDMTLTAGYPSASGTFANRPSYMWNASNSSWGKLTTVSSSTAMGYVDRLALRSSVDLAVEDMRSDLSVLRTDLGAFASDVSNRLDNIESGSPSVYVSPGGTRYANVIYYGTAQPNGKVAVTTVGNYYASTEYRVVPCYGGDASSNYWIFEPAYVDTDANGLRLHYLPKSQKTIAAKTYNAGYLYVPRDFYWQNGVIYVVVDSFNGSTFSGRIRFKYSGTDANAYPNGLLSSSAGSSLGTSQYRSMTFDSREGTIMGTGTSISSFYLKTEQGKVLSSYDSVLWIPESPSMSQLAVVNWLATFVR